VAVFDPTSSSTAIDEGTKEAVREIISSTFVNTGKYTIVERSLLDKVMKEQAFSNTDVVDESQATELGRLAGANKVVLSVVTLVGGRNMLSVKVIDVQTATIDQQKTKIVSSNELLDVVEPLTLELLGEEVTPTTTTTSGQAGKASSTSAQVKASQVADCGCEIQAEDVDIMATFEEMRKQNEEAEKRSEKVRKTYPLREFLNKFCPKGWRPPTFKELECMYREKDRIGGFDNGRKYHSSPSSKGYVCIDFETGKKKTVLDIGITNLRCVRDK
jgi:hypothetical protein